MNIVIKAIQRRGLLRKNQAEEIRKAFHKCFEDTIGIRNGFVHDGSPTWKGEKHFNLLLSNKLPIDSALNDACNHYADILRDEGLRMSRLLQRIVKGAAYFMSKSKITPPISKK